MERTDDVRREYTDASDASLVVSIGRYQQLALAEAYRRHAGAVFGLSKRLLGDAARAGLSYLDMTFRPDPGDR